MIVLAMKFQVEVLRFIKLLNNFSFDTNICGYLFVSFFDTNVSEKKSSLREMTQIVHTKNSYTKKIYLPFVVSTMF